MAELNNRVFKVFSNGPRRPRNLDLNFKITSYKSKHPDPSTGSAIGIIYLAAIFLLYAHCEGLVLCSKPQ